MDKNIPLLTPQDKSEYFPGVVLTPKYNRMWGTDYLLMDSRTLMEETGGKEYENVIDMFCNIWNAYEYRTLNNIGV